MEGDFVSSKELEDKTIEQIKDEYNFDEIKDAFDHAAVLHQLGFFYGGDNENFVRACNFLSPNEDNNEFVSFLCSDRGQNIMTNNSLSIHIESGNIFYQNLNTNENFYSFLLTQQDETKRIIPKRIAYHHSFEKYIKSYLPYFSIEETEKFDLYSNKNSKYLLCKFNDWIESLGAEKRVIRHTPKAEDFHGLKKIEEKDKKFLIEIIIHSVENENPSTISIEKNPKIIPEIEKTYKICRRVISRCLQT